MKRKRMAPVPETVVPSEILDQAKVSAHPDTLSRRSKCVVCGADCAPTSQEQLCWVCRRLKISAWHEAEQQMPAQE